jgi:glutamate-1-semialdehyde 2,1-aminomutase
LCDKLQNISKWQKFIPADIMETSTMFKRSRELQVEANDLLPGGTNSGARAAITKGSYEGLSISTPAFFDKASGSHIFDVDQNEFIDYHLSFGPIILGHSHPTVVAAVKEQLERGAIFGGNSEIELKLCRKFRKYVACGEQVVLCSTGSEATSVARRIVKAHSKKRKMLKFEGHYHGWADWNMVGAVGSVIGSFARNMGQKVVSAEGVSESVIDDIIVLPWNDPGLLEETIRREGDQIAGVITEVYQANWGVIPPEKGYLELMRKLTKENGIDLIFDEVITGFRLGLRGAQEATGIVPDVATYAKCVANGLTIAAVAATKEIMEPVTSDRTYIAGTYNGNPLAVAAALATVTELESYGSYSKIYSRGNELMKGIRDGFADAHIPGVVQGPGPMFSVFFTDLESVGSTRDVYSIPMHPHIRRSAVFFQGLINRGVMAMPTRYGRLYLSFAHTEEDIQKTIEASHEALREASAIR